jgi:tetratricopeptide (TPR) repeat protein
MNSQRIEMLKKLISEEPQDPFYRYGLALEFITTNRPESLRLLKELIVNNPDYLPTYYQAGLLCIESDKMEEGEEILKKGIELARQQKDFKTMNELISLLENI